MAPGRLKKRNCLSVAMYLLASMYYVDSATAEGDMTFAFKNGKLYAKIDHQFETRALSVLLYLLDMDGAAVPDMVGHVHTLWQDSPAPSTPNSFGCYRTVGGAQMLLPDWDLYGWPETWVAPWPHTMQAMSEALIPWERRVRAAFWTGAHTSDIRKVYSSCQNPTIVADVIEWHHLRREASLPFITGVNKLKPISGDLRRHTNYKFVVYLHGNAFSSSLKRVASAGAVLLLPDDVNSFETIISKMITADCPTCFLTYDHNDVCGSIIKAMNSITDAEAKSMADRLHTFIKESVTVQKLMDKTIEEMRRNAENAKPVVMWANETEANFDDGLKLPRILCANIQKYFKDSVSAHQFWQIDAWFDTNCKMKPTADYLAYTAI